MSSIAVDKSETRIRRMFGAIAPSYDLLNHLLSLNIDRYWRRKTTELAPPNGEGPILDLCTGTGDLAFAYDQAAGGRVPVIGADFCGPMLDLAKDTTRNKDVGDRIRFVQGDAQRLPFRDNLFQIVCVAFGLRNVKDTDRGLAEMKRVTRAGGKVVILELSRPRGPVLGRLYRFYFRYLLPLIGQTISRSKENAYRYLQASVSQFPDGEVLADRLRSHGLRDVHWHPFTFGIASLYIGTKS